MVEGDDDDGKLKVDNDDDDGRLIWFPTMSSISISLRWFHFWVRFLQMVVVVVVVVDFDLGYWTGIGLGMVNG
ncbi:hypothetical protein LWI28_018405 [Acer negundo]|uniref:Transmembrane protein n=1 Tax=Acer negundo TaxID=4023 RepID=A0AAD5P7G0_ACENE|nr:hypothetical protein LWI28_018405 [Acer negundo]